MGIHPIEKQKGRPALVRIRPRESRRPTAWWASSRRSGPAPVSRVARITATALLFTVLGATTTPARVLADTMDAPAPGILVEPAVLTVDEGGPHKFLSVSLKSRPTANVQVRVWRSTAEHVSTNKFRLRFTTMNWNRPQTVRFVGREDADAVDETTTLTITASGGDYDEVENVITTVRVNDDESNNVHWLSAELAVTTTLAEHQPRVAAAFCMTPIGAELSKLRGFQLARLPADSDVNAVSADPQHGASRYYSVPVKIAGCNDGQGVALTQRFLPDMTHVVRMRARKGAEWVVSNPVTFREHDPGATLKARLWGDGFGGPAPDGEPILADVPKTVHGEFEIAVAFGYYLPFLTNTDPVEGLDLDDFVVTNATLTEPPGGFEYEANLGYRLRVTPTTPGEDVTVQVKAGAVTEPSAGEANLESNVFRRATAAAPAGRSAVEVSAAHASTTEAPHAVVSFPVRLSRAAQDAVTVGYATSDGTARAGEDYVAASGTLTFQPGEVERHVTVSVLDDARDEGEETFTLRLSTPTGATLADAVATGTIVNTDPLPRAWITRFGRTVAEQTVDAIATRLSGAQGARIVIAGTVVERSGSVVVDPDQRPRPHHSPAFADPDRSTTPNRTLGRTARQLALTSEFRLDSGPAEDAPIWTTWGRIARADFESERNDFRLDGGVTTGFLGFDVAHDHWLAGVAISLSRGDGSFEHRETRSTDGSTRLESRLTSLFPYARYSLTERTDVWGLLGYGTGDLTLTEPAGEHRLREIVTETEIEMRMGAVGARGRILAAEQPGELELAVRTDAFWVRTQSDAVESARSGRMEASSGDASRLRLLLEGSRTVEIGSGTTFTPSAEIGVRHDGGDAETGTGVVVGAGAQVAAPGVAIEVAVNSLVAHEESDSEGWNASGSIRIDPGASGQGISFTVAPAWGTPGSSAERLRSRHDPAGMRSRRELGTGRRLSADLGYGLRAPAGSGLLTPYTGAAWKDDGAASYRLGVRWDVTPRASLGLEGSRVPAGGEDGSENALTLRASMRW